ncbi:hypothetical protein [Halorarum salinum]|uniref:Uncharacterized protein n=1 Tax=Halorarum salinum TaxID=2743089 RepID=A0A7D5QIA4_9EURY|nr:hypothetical protein [Halobaculum salinum]QLG62864.1 hypothetical protein HUG12_14455 [Halobaculum salinum]
MSANEDLVECCPECGRARIYKLKRSLNGGHADHEFAYSCRICSHKFDDPDEREPRNDGGMDPNSLAARLDRASPEDIGLSPVGDRGDA